MTVAELFEQHVASGLAQYRGNFHFLEKIIQAGELPDATDPAVRLHIDELKRFLSSQGIQDTDDFLLRFGLVVPGFARGVHPPISVLSTERGGFSRQRLEQAAVQVGRLREALIFGRRFFPNLSSDARAALQELSERARQAVASDDEWAALHVNLSPEAAAQLMARGFECLDSDAKDVREVGESVLQTLAAYRRDGLGTATQWLVDRGIFYPGSLYRGAPNEVAKSLVQRIENARGLQLNHLLVALAWTRGEIAHEAFGKWKKRAPAWRSQIHVPAENYLFEAGWSLDDEGARRELISLSCHLIVKKVEKADAGLTVSCRIPIDEKCPACGSALRWLFDFSAVPSHFFTGDRERAPRKVFCCLSCACFSPIFSRYGQNGAAEWHPANDSQNSDPAEIWPPWVCQLSAKPFPPFAAANPFGLGDASTLGGVPMWLQDAEYPQCPDCSKPMQFLAQFYNLAMPKPEEGIFYSFYCPGCQVAAVSYQQT